MTIVSFPRSAFVRSTSESCLVIFCDLNFLSFTCILLSIYLHPAGAGSFLPILSCKLLVVPCHATSLVISSTTKKCVACNSLCTSLFFRLLNRLFFIGFQVPSSRVVVLSGQIANPACRAFPFFFPFLVVFSLLLLFFFFFFLFTAANCLYFI